MAPGGPTGNKKDDGAPLVASLFGGVVRSDDLGLRHHSVLILRKGVAVWKQSDTVKINPKQNVKHRGHEINKNPT